VKVIAHRWDARIHAMDKLPRLCDAKVLNLLVIGIDTVRKSNDSMLIALDNEYAECNFQKSP
jgi:hypothetical protein